MLAILPEMAGAPELEPAASSGDSSLVAVSQKDSCFSSSRWFFSISNSFSAGCLMLSTGRISSMVNLKCPDGVLRLCLTNGPTSFVDTTSPMCMLASAKPMLLSTALNERSSDAQVQFTASRARSSSAICATVPVSYLFFVDESKLIGHCSVDSREAKVGWTRVVRLWKDCPSSSNLPRPASGEPELGLPR